LSCQTLSRSSLAVSLLRCLSKRLIVPGRRKSAAAAVQPAPRGTSGPMPPTALPPLAQEARRGIFLGTSGRVGLLPSQARWLVRAGPKQKIAAAAAISVTSLARVGCQRRRQSLSRSTGWMRCGQAHGGWSPLATRSVVRPGGLPWATRAASILINVTLPVQSVPRPDGYLRALSAHAMEVAGQYAQWSAVGWQVDGAAVTARVR
jgi:hypothetical protein